MGNLVNVTDCEELAASIDTSCSFDSEPVRNFTRDVVANGGDYTIGFWVRPLDANSIMDEKGTFVPHVDFMNSVSPPQLRFSTGVWNNWKDG